MFDKKKKSVDAKINKCDLDTCEIIINKQIISHGCIHFLKVIYSFLLKEENQKLQRKTRAIQFN